MLVLHKQSLLTVPNSISFLLVLEYSGACHSVPGVILVEKDAIRFFKLYDSGISKLQYKIGDFETLES